MNTKLKQIVKACKKGDPKAQRELYDLHKGKMFVLCQRYANNREDAEDILQEGFIAVFKCLDQYREDGPLGAWVRKVILNAALQYIRKQKHQLVKMEENEIEYLLNKSIDYSPSESREQELIKLIQKLPLGFRTVFNLYILEGYTHQQIADELNISVGTSKSQLNRAKAHYKKLLAQNLTT
ncbi:MAG: RNA polymerase sigma factor [Bacteroidota bacterium]